MLVVHVIGFHWTGKDLQTGGMDTAVDKGCSVNIRMVYRNE